MSYSSARSMGRTLGRIAMFVLPILVIFGIGVDVLEAARIQRTLERFGERFELRVFTEIERAKANGAWSLLDSVERMEVPDDLTAALATHPGAADQWAAWSPSMLTEYARKRARAVRSIMFDSTVS